MGLILEDTAQREGIASRPLSSIIACITVRSFDGVERAHVRPAIVSSPSTPTGCVHVMRIARYPVEHQLETGTCRHTECRCRPSKLHRKLGPGRLLARQSMPSTPVLRLSGVRVVMSGMATQSSLLSDRNANV